MRPRDHERPAPKRAQFDARGQAQGERISEYFDFARWPEKQAMKVTRVELLAILMREHQVREALTWRHRVWTFLKRPFGSAPATLAITKGEVERGEGS